LTTLRFWRRVSGTGVAPQGMDPVVARPLAGVADADAIALPVAAGVLAVAQLP
jgi:hypothetical protein